LFGVVGVRDVAAFTGANDAPSRLHRSSSGVGKPFGPVAFAIATAVS